MSDFDELRKAFEDNDAILLMSSNALLEMKGESVVRDLAAPILSFLATRPGIASPAHLARRYSERCAVLAQLQKRFDERGVYEASSLAQVPPLDGEDYRRALLLSIVTTLHRFEVMQRLDEFLRLPNAAPRELLSIGFGSGYEIYRARMLCPGHKVTAFDTDRDALAYARDFLTHVGVSADGLRSAAFPTRAAEPGEHRDAYGKIIVSELLEHLEDPAVLLDSVRAALHPRGHAYLTMAINLAQEDHIFLYRSADEARAQVAAAGLRIGHEWLAPVSIFPFADDDRERIFKRGNYLCVAERSGVDR